MVTNPAHSLCAQSFPSAHSLAVSPSFFVVMKKSCVSPEYSTTLRIPREYQKLYGSALGEEMFLQISTGKEWQVKVSDIIGRGKCFRWGWPAFSGDNHLMIGDLLVFKLLTGSRFSVQIFGESGIEKIDGHGIKATEKNSNKKRKRRHVLGTTTPEQIHGDEAMDGKGAEYAKKSRKTGQDRNLDQNPSFKTSPFASVRDKTIFDSQANPCGLSYRIAESPTHIREAGHVCCGHITPFKGKHNGGKLILMGPGLNRGLPMLQFYDARRSVLNERMQRFVLKEARRFVKSAALSFNVNGPSCVRILKRTKSWRGHSIKLKAQFARQFLPKESTYMTLIDSAGDSWSIKWMGSDQSRITTGWSKFVEFHSLGERDACVFQLVNDKAMKVFIFRVSDFLIKIAQISKHGSKRRKGTQLNSGNQIRSRARTRGQLSRKEEGDPAADHIENLLNKAYHDILERAQKLNIKNSQANIADLQPKEAGKTNGQANGGADLCMKEGEQAVEHTSCGFDLCGKEGGEQVNRDVSQMVNLALPASSLLQQVLGTDTVERA